MGHYNREDGHLQDPFGHHKRGPELEALAS